MGYTHYWYRPVEVKEEVFEEIKKDVLRLEPVWKSKGVEVELSDNMIFIDGSCETFVFPKDISDDALKYYIKMEDGKVFDFCKTNHGTYDIIVQAVLIIIKFHLGNDIKVTSDGDNYAWEGAKNIVSEYVGCNSQEFRLDQDSDSIEEDLGTVVKFNI